MAFALAAARHYRAKTHAIFGIRWSLAVRPINRKLKRRFVIRRENEITKRRNGDYPEGKVTGLSVVSIPSGRFKAAYFQSLGYSSSEWEFLERDIRSLLEYEVVKTKDTEYGRKFEVRGELSGPLGQNANIVTVWIVLKGEQFPRFITAYPGDK